MDKEKIFSKIGYPYLDRLIEYFTAMFPGIKVQYPIADFTVDGKLFKIGTFDVEVAINTYSKYKEEIAQLNKEINRLDKTIDNLNDKFCNEKWLTRCPKDLIIKEHNKLTYLEEERELKYKQIKNRLYIYPTFILE